MIFAIELKRKETERKEKKRSDVLKWYKRTKTKVTSKTKTIPLRPALLFSFFSKTENVAG